MKKIDLVDYNLKELLKKQIDKKILKFNLPKELVTEMLEELIILHKN